MSAVLRWVGGIAIAFLVGTGVGMFTESRFQKADQTVAAQRAIQQTAQQIVEATQTSQAVEVKAQTVAKDITQIKQAVAARILAPKEPPHATRPAATGPVVPAAPAVPLENRANGLAAPAQAFDADRFVSDYRFDVGTVRLLNAARTGTAVDAAGGSDEASRAASDVGIAKFVDNDLDVVQLYRDLAARHDALVDSVEQHLKEQANRPACQ